MTDVTTSGLPSSLLDAPEGRRVSLEPGQILIEQGDDAESVYILINGSLEISRSVDNGTVVLAMIDEPGSLVGEMVAIGGGTRTATVTAQLESELMALPIELFQARLREDPTLARELASVAVRRAEEAELAELLADHFGIVDEDTLVSTCGRVDWRRLDQGEVLFEEGEESDAVYFVVRGRLLASLHDPSDGSQVKIGEMGRGDVVGEIGLLGRTPRTATVVAIRDSVVARMAEPAFLELVERQPRMIIELCLRAVDRANNHRSHSAPSTVLAVVTAEISDAGWVVDGLQSELRRSGAVRRLSPRMVDQALETPGIHNIRRGEIGDVRVSRLVHEFEIEADYLLVEVGMESGPWAQRALGMADSVLIVTPPVTTDDRVTPTDSILGACPADVSRTVVVVHPESSASHGSAVLKKRYGAEDVIHVRRESREDLARLARVSTGSGNSLILSGGGGRGFAHIGVYRALVELGFPIDIVGGTSIGGVIGTVIADAFTPNEIVDWAQRHFPRALDYTLPLVSLTKGNRIAKSARETFGQRDIEDLWLSYFSMSTDLTTSRPHVHDHGSVVLAIRATSAIPGVMPPVPHGERLLIDGGILNNLPIDVARHKSPAGKVIAIDVTPPRGPEAHGDYGLSVSGWQALRSTFGANGARYPKISAVLMRSMITASMRERDEQVMSGLADCYIDLDMRGVSMLEFEDPAAVAQRGYEAALPELERWLGSVDEPVL